MPEPPESPVERFRDDRLDSWKEIASYMKRDVKTVQRWEKREGMPVHRHVHDKLGSVYAFRSDLDTWTRNRRPASPDEATALPDDEVAADAPTANSDADREPHPLLRVLPGRPVFAITTVGVIVAAALTAWLLRPRDDVANPLAEARFQQLTDFGGVEQAAAISRDGKLAAFLSDRDGQMDVWLTQVGTGEFYNLTKGAARDIVNPSVRTLGFSPDGTLVTFWARRLDAAHQSEISVWGVPVLGGAPRVYLDGVAEFDWSNDSAKLVYHTPGPGDPTFVRAAVDTATPQQIFSAPAGLHSHFPLWSPDGAFLYFVQGTLPDRMDIWRIRSTGGAAEKITNHDAVVTYPVFLTPRTLLYLASDRDGSGPWIHAVDVERRAPRRVSFGIDHYTSLAASADRRRLVATLASPKGTLWRLALDAGRADTSDARQISLTTGSGSSPRLGDGFLLYVSAKGGGDSIWKLQGDRAMELWSASDTRVVGGPAITRGGRRIAFTLRRSDGQTLLAIVNIDGTDARTVPTPLAIQGAPTWRPDGETITVAALVDGTPRLFDVPLDGRPPVRLTDDHAVDPAWSPDGQMVVFSGADVGTTFPVKAVTSNGGSQAMRELTLTRGARHVTFMSDRRVLVVLRGEVRHKNLWSIDLDTGEEHQLTDFSVGFDVRDFDVSPDGREVVIEQVEEHSDLVLLDLPNR